MNIEGFKTIDTVTQFTGTTYIDNLWRNLLIFDYTEQWFREFSIFCFEFSKQKADFLSTSSIDRNPLFLRKTTHFVVLYSRFRFIYFLIWFVDKFHSLYSSNFLFLSKKYSAATVTEQVKQLQRYNENVAQAVMNQNSEVFSE